MRRTRQIPLQRRASTRRDLVATAVVGAVLTTSLVVIGVAWRSGPEQVAVEASAQGPELLPASGSLGADLRALPLRSGSDPVGAAFPDGLTNATDVSEELVELATPLGLGDDVLWLAGLEVHPDGDSYAFVGDPYDGGVPAYPYQYFDVDPIVAYGLDAAAAQADPGAVLDLTALLTLAAGRSWDDPYQFGNGAVVAYSILRHALANDETCDLQLQLAFVTSLGMYVNDDNLSTEVEQARSLCPDDPTPLWLRSQSRARYLFESNLLFGSLLGAPLADLLARAEDDFEALRTEFPDLPLGWAGWADVLLDRADASEGRGLRPFQVRAWRRGALHLYEEARTRSADPGLLVGHARALTALGEYDRARAILAGVPGDAHDLVAFVTAEVRLEQAAHDFAAVVDTLEETTVAFPTGLELVGGNHYDRLPGYGRLTAMPTQVVDGSLAEGGGADTSDIAFIPRARTDWSSDGACLEVDAIDALVAEGREDEAETWASGSFSTPADPVLGNCLEDPRSATRLATTSPDRRQDLLRWADRLGDAAKAVEDWKKEDPDDYAAHQRAGEIAYLDGDYAAAADGFESALDMWIEQSDGDSYPESVVFTGLDLVPTRDLLGLQLAAALEADGDVAGARDVLGEIAERVGATSPDDDPMSRSATLMYAHAQLGGLSLADGDFGEAGEELRAALAAGHAVDDLMLPGTGDAEGDHGIVVLRGSQENNLALVLAREGETEEAVTVAEAALAHDPASPIFLDTLAFTHQLNGDVGRAVAAYEEALHADPSTYVSANNLAVLLAQRGDYEQARGLLRDALAANPEYAKAWHNLGVVDAHLGAGLTDVQGAFATAGRLSRSLRGEDATLLVDDTIYDSGLDISKALAPDWSYAQTAHSSHRGFALSMLLLLLLRLGWTLGLDRAVEALSTRFMTAAAGTQRRWTRIWRPAPAALALSVTALALALPAMRWASDWADRLVALVAVGALIVAPLCVRVLLARPLSTPYVGWLPAILVGAVAAPFGVTLAPFPGIDDAAARQRRVAWAAAGTVAAVTVVFAILALVSAVPLARFMAMAGTALMASIMLPVEPFDGKRLRGRVAGLAVTLVLAFATIAFTANWI